MPTRHPLQPITAQPGARPALGPLSRVAVPMLLGAVLLAATGGIVHGMHIVAAILALVVAAPVGVAAWLDYRRARALAARALAAGVARPVTTDPVTGAIDAASWEVALPAALNASSADPLTLLRLSVAAPDGTDQTTEQRDRVLTIAAIRWRSILRPVDVMARVDSEDFAILLPGCDPPQAAEIVQRLREAVPSEAQVSIGVATWDHVESDAAFAERAERGLSEAISRDRRDPLTDPGRVAAVHATGLATRGDYEEFNRVASSVAWLLDTPIVIVTLFDESWQHFIGTHGFGNEGPHGGVAAEDAICRQTLATGQPLVVSDTERHPILNRIPATRTYGIAACASVPITSAGGQVLGTICAMVLERHSWTADDVALLKLTARRVSERLATGVAVPVAG